MKRSETAVLLAKVAAYDRRTVGEADIEAWTEALDGLVALRDALTAVRDHFRESSDWVMPKMIIDRAKKIRVERIRRAGKPDFPPSLTPTDERRWLTYWHAELERTDDAGLAQGYADRSMNITRVESVPTDPAKVERLLANFAASRAIGSVS